MDDGDGAFTMELQAAQIAHNATVYNGSHPCPMCGVILNPTQVINSNGLCITCTTRQHNDRIKNRMV